MSTHLPSDPRLDAPDRLLSSRGKIPEWLLGWLVSFGFSISFVLVCLAIG